jgi:hypothetical protein
MQRILNTNTLNQICWYEALNALCPKKQFLYVIDLVKLFSGQKSSQTVNSINQAEQSGEVLRSVIRTNTFTSQTEPPVGAALNPETGVTSVQPTDKREVPRHWEKVLSLSLYLKYHRSNLARRP